VGGVPVPVVHIVSVIPVRHGYVTAVRSVLMGVTLVSDVGGLDAFVHVIAVRVVDMPVMRVIGVIAVRNRHVAAALAVGVLMAGVHRMLKRVRHRTRPLCARTHLA
jgi:hypothetical protein